MRQDVTFVFFVPIHVAVKEQEKSSERESEIIKSYVDRTKKQGLSEVIVSYKDQCKFTLLHFSCLSHFE